MWHIARYKATALFSLRPYNATTSGGKTLIAPTPFAFKMALLDVLIRTKGLNIGIRDFPFLRDLSVAIRLPEHLVVNNTFIKILRSHKKGIKDSFGTGIEGRMGNTIAYREFVYFGGALDIAIKNQQHQRLSYSLDELFSQINYIGKRGGFIQFEQASQKEELSEDFTLLTPEENAPFNAHGIMQMMDDCGPAMTFEHVDIYNKKKISLQKENGRIIKPVVLPYQPIKSSRNFTLYERIN